MEGRREGGREEGGKRKEKIEGSQLYQVLMKPHPPFSSSAHSSVSVLLGKKTSSIDHTVELAARSRSVTTSYCWNAHSGSRFPVDCNHHMTIT